MKSTTEHELFLRQKYKAARSFFFLVIQRLELAKSIKTNSIFGYFYLADKLTQRHTFGAYNAETPGRGSYLLDQNSVCNCPSWFSKSLEVDKN